MRAQWAELQAVPPIDLLAGAFLRPKEGENVTLVAEDGSPLASSSKPDNNAAVEMMVALFPGREMKTN